MCSRYNEKKKQLRTMIGEFSIECYAGTGYVVYDPAIKKYYWSDTKDAC